MNRQLPTTQELMDMAHIDAFSACTVRVYLKWLLETEQADVYTGAGSKPYRWYIWINKGRYKLGEWAFAYITGDTIQPV